MLRHAKTFGFGSRSSKEHAVKQKSSAVAALLSAVLALACGAKIARAQGKPDYLTPAEANKIRNAYYPADRIHLFIQFAGDRLRKLQYELHLTSPQYHKTQILNGLLNAYSNCMEEATDRIDEAEHGGAPILPAVKEMHKEAKSYLQTLQKIKAEGGPELASIKDSLDEALDGTQYALKDAAKASKEYGAAPIRRKP